MADDATTIIVILRFIRTPYGMTNMSNPHAMVRTLSAAVRAAVAFSPAPGENSDR